MVTRELHQDVELALRRLERRSIDARGIGPRLDLQRPDPPDVGGLACVAPDDGADALGVRRSPFQAGQVRRSALSPAAIRSASRFVRRWPLARPRWRSSPLRAPPGRRWSDRRPAINGEAGSTARDFLEPNPSELPWYELTLPAATTRHRAASSWWPGW
ncbi:MAG: hypothetical protein ACK52I_30885 [Pseudomonadota bacterium]